MTKKTKRGRKGKVGTQISQRQPKIQSARPNGSSSPSMTVTQVRSMISQSWKGPTPSPQDLEHYERILPGSASRIIAIAEQQALHVRVLEENQNTHRISLEKAIVSGTERRANIGQWTSLLLALFGLASGAFAFQLGYSAQGALIVVAVFAEGGIVWFIGGRPPKTKDS